MGRNERTLVGMSNESNLIKSMSPSVEDDDVVLLEGP